MYSLPRGNNRAYRAAIRAPAHTEPCRVQTLSLRFHALSKRNHKGLSVEHFFRTLNKAVTIACEDRACPSLFRRMRATFTTLFL